MLTPIQREIYRKEIPQGEERKRRDPGTELLKKLRDYVTVIDADFFGNAKGYRKVGKIISVPESLLIVTGKSIDASSGFYETTAELQYASEAAERQLEILRTIIQSSGLERITGSAAKLFEDRFGADI